MTLRKRTGLSLLAWLVTIDQLVYVTIAVPFTIAGLSPVPNAKHTISGVLGGRAAAGQAWARWGAAFVDALFLMITLGEERNHCAVVAEAEGRC